MTTITLELPEDVAEKVKAMTPEAFAAVIRDVAGEPKPEKPKNRLRELRGKYKGQFTMAPDFDAPLDDFAEYM